VFEEGPAGWTQIMDEADLPEATPTTATADGVLPMLYRSGDVVRTSPTDAASVPPLSHSRTISLSDN
jgi:hypothetical protein